MITNDSKVILDYLTSVFQNQNSEMINFATIADATQLPIFKVDAALRYLEDEGYVKIKFYKSGSFVHQITHKGINYKEFESALNPTAQTNIFNAPVTGSAISNTGCITVNNGISFEEALSFIHSQNISSKDTVEAEKLISYIEALTENDTPLKKGFLSKFSDILSKHHWLPELVMKLLFQYLTMQ